MQGRLGPAKNGNNLDEPSICGLRSFAFCIDFLYFSKFEHIPGFYRNAASQICIYIYVYVYACVYIALYTYIHTHTLYIYMHTYIYIYTHTHLCVTVYNL